MFSLQDNPVLTPYQIRLLKDFFGSALGQQFFLTGGTALAAFYLGHRYSKDLDFFTLSNFDTLELEKLIESMAAAVSASPSTKVKTEHYWEVYLQSKEQDWVQRLDFVREQPVVFGERKVVDGVIVDDLENIATNKILTIYGRLEPKDYVDFYFIIQEYGFDFFELFERTKKKDAGLHEFYFGNIIAQAGELQNFPQTLKPFDEAALKKFFLDLSDSLLRRIKPVA